MMLTSSKELLKLFLQLVGR